MYIDDSPSLPLKASICRCIPSRIQKSVTAVMYSSTFPRVTSSWSPPGLRQWLWYLCTRDPGSNSNVNLGEVGKRLF